MRYLGEVGRAWRSRNLACTRTGFGMPPQSWAGTILHRPAADPFLCREAHVFGQPFFFFFRSTSRAVAAGRTATEAHMVRLLCITRPAPGPVPPHGGLRQGSMANYQRQPIGCDAPPTRHARSFGASGYGRNEPFEHIYRHHRRYRITEAAEEIQSAVWPALFNGRQQMTCGSLPRANYSARFWAPG